MGISTFTFNFLFKAEIIFSGKVHGYADESSSQNNTRPDAGPNQAMLLGTLILLVNKPL